MSDLNHRFSRMTGRDPHQSHRTATPLELLFDLVFVIAFGTAANELAHALAEDHLRTALFGFGLSTFAIIWAWIQFTWFASAYDTDDWVYRLTTMLQMAGVLIFALGIPQMYASIEGKDYIDNTVMVLGYVVMRVAMVFQWLRAAQQDPSCRPVAMTYVASIVISQIGWVIQALSHTSLGATIIWIAVLLLIELGGPFFGETRRGGTPWHPHHIAERYGLLVIITLGEGAIGTMAAMSGIYDESGWSLDFVLILAAGMAITFGLWWCYFAIPFAELLEQRRERSFAFGYGQIPLIAALAAVGAGLHVAGYYLEYKAGSHDVHFELTTTGTVLTTAVPVGVFLIGLFVQYFLITRSWDPFHWLLLAGVSIALVTSVAMAAAGVGLAWCLVVLACAPWLTVLGYELVGHRHNERVLAEGAQRSS